MAGEQVLDRRPYRLQDHQAMADVNIWGYQGEDPLDLLWLGITPLGRRRPAQRSKVVSKPAQLLAPVGDELRRLAPDV